METDFRTNRTKARIQHALISALQQKTFDQVTVTELIKMAKISRRSFYVHYHDKYELLTEIEGQIMNSFTTVITKQNQNLTPVKDFHAPQVRQNTTNAFKSLLQTAESYRSELAVLLSENGDYHFKKKLEKLIENEIAARLKNYHAQLRDDIPQDYANAILVGNLMDLIIIWLQKKKPETPAEFAKILTRSRLIAPLELLQF